MPGDSLPEKKPDCYFCRRPFEDHTIPPDTFPFGEVADGRTGQKRTLMSYCMTATCPGYVASKSELFAKWEKPS